MKKSSRRGDATGPERIGGSGRIKSPVKAGLLAIAYAVAVVCFLVFTPSLKYSAGVFLLLPTLVSGIQYGVAGGTVSALLAFPISVLLFTLQGGWEFHMTRHVFLPVAFITVIGVTVGYISRLNRNLSDSNNELNKALSNVKTLSGLLPICASCKKIRDDQGYWSRVEEYIGKHSQAEFTHSICPDCIDKFYSDKNPPA